MLKKKVKMYNGVEIPVIGLGTWQLPDVDAAAVCKEAIDVGYIHIDSASAYENECGVGEGIRQSGIKREDIFITTKIPAEIKDYEGAKAIIQQSLKRLGVDYIDLMIIHCPIPWALYHQGVRSGYDEANVAVYRALEEAYDRGELRSIGVSNFDVHDLENIMEHCRIKPMINQIPWFVGRRNEAVKEYCKNHKILVESYSPLGTGRLLSQPLIVEMAEKYHVTPAQLCIKFALMDVDITLPKTTHRERMIENAQLDFEISSEDFEKLKQAQF